MTGRSSGKIILFMVVLFCLLLNAAENKRPVIFVSIGPQLESVRRIGGGAVDAHAMLPSGLNPETFSPDARGMSAFGQRGKAESDAAAFLCLRSSA